MCEILGLDKHRTLSFGDVIDMEKDPPIPEIVNLHKQDDYEGILELFQATYTKGNPQEITILRSLLWPVPTDTDLTILAGFILSREVGHIFSIGCGTGLLEYLLSIFIQNLGAAASSNGDSGETGTLQTKRRSKLIPGLTGIEIDSAWWTSRYAPPLFQPLLYVGETFFKEKNFGSMTMRDLAIFSYFNSIPNFKEYLASFHGAYIVLIGPMRKQFCAPNPMDLKEHPDLPNKEWNLILFQRFGLEEVDYIGIYERRH